MKRKRRKMFTVLLIAVELMVIVMLIIMLPWEYEDNNKFSPSTANEESAEEIGKVTIYQDGSLVFEYQGPLRIKHIDGKHEIELETFSCSCEVDE